MKLRAICWIVMGVVPAAATAQETPTLLSILAEFDRFAEHVVWPGFSPRRIPLAIFDGTATWLARHPNPPSEFTRDPRGTNLWRMEGKHNVIRANTSVDLGGSETATVLINQVQGGSATQYASLLIHEAFHVFQRVHYPHWGGNEVELFTYPVENQTVLVHRRLESDALLRSLATQDPELAACWAKQALGHRHARFANLTPGAIDYERGTELLEGLAEYVEFLAIGGDPETVLSDRVFDADEVRERSYATGTALAILLDRFAPGWMVELAETKSASLDEILAGSIQRQRSASCQLPDADRRAVDDWAAAAISDLRARRSAIRNRVFSQDGWTLVVVGPAEDLLFPSGFDPLNVDVVSPSEVVHTAWIAIGNSAGSLEVVGHDVLTEGVGPHPLFNGLRRVTVSGLSAEPIVRQVGNALVISGNGIDVRFQDADVRRETRTVTISLQ